MSSLSLSPILHSSVIEHLPAALFCKDAKNDYRFVLWNQKASEMWGASAEQVIGKTDFDFFEKEEAEFFRKKDMETMAAGQVVHIPEEPTQSAPGTKAKWVETWKVPVRNEKGEFQYLLGISHDITESRKAKDTFRQKESFFENLIDHLPAVVYAKKPDGKYLFINRQFEELFHTDRESIKAKNDFDLFPTEIAQPLRENDLDILKHRTSIESIEVVPNDGEMRTYNSTKFPIMDKKGEVYATCGISTDITEKLQSEKELEDQRLKAIAASRLANLGEMSAGIAHEINNPLAIISGYAHRLNRLCEQDKLETQDVLEISEKLLKTTQRISKIIVSLRSFAREGSPDPLEKVSINHLLEDIKPFCRERFNKLNVSLTVQPLDADPFVQARQVELSQVLINLLNNALDATQAEKDPWVKVTVSLSDTETVRVTISNSGSSIPADIAKKIFDPFFTTKEVGKGTGLGLSLSKGIIENHGGKLFLNPDSPYTEFVIELPLFKEDKAQ